MLAGATFCCFCIPAGIIMQVLTKNSCHRRYIATVIMMDQTAVLIHLGTIAEDFLHRFHIATSFVMDMATGRGGDRFPITAGVIVGMMAVQHSYDTAAFLRADMVATVFLAVFVAFMDTFHDLIAIQRMLVGARRPGGCLYIATFRRMLPMVDAQSFLLCGKCRAWQIGQHQTDAEGQTQYSLSFTHIHCLIHK